MLWKKTWQPDVVLLLVGAVILSFVSGNLAVGVLCHFKVAGFHSLEDTGSVLLATFSFQGMAIIAAIVFLKLHEITWREALGLADGTWWRRVLLAITVLVVVLPVLLGLKVGSELVLTKLGWPVEDQEAVELFTNIQSVWLRVYFAFFAVVLAPVAEEFVFRGILFSAALKAGQPVLGWIGVSFLFALIHFSAPIFLPLFVLALALTWLCEKTGGLFAPIFAHSLFNAANLALLFLTQ